MVVGIVDCLKIVTKNQHVPFPTFFYKTAVCVPGGIYSGTWYYSCTVPFGTVVISTGTGNPEKYLVQVPGSSSIVALLGTRAHVSKTSTEIECNGNAPRAPTEQFWR